MTKKLVTKKQHRWTDADTARFIALVRAKATNGQIGPVFGVSRQAAKAYRNRLLRLGLIERMPGGPGVTGLRAKAKVARPAQCDDKEESAYGNPGIARQSDRFHAAHLAAGVNFTPHNLQARR